MNNLAWYFNLYYKFRDYPIAELNSTLKNSELKALYTNMLRKLFLLFQLDNRKDGEIEGLISKNNYDLMLNKKAENNLAQEELLSNQTPSQARDSHLVTPEEQDIRIDSVQSLDNDRDMVSRASATSKGSRASRVSRLKWVVELSPFERNMDVFYELMIKMIRISFRRLMIQTFAMDRYGMYVSKEAIKQILQLSSQFQTLVDYSEKQAQKGQTCNDQMIQIVHYPPTIEEMKFQFLKYCISSKVYNNPRDSSHNSACSSSNQSQASDLDVYSNKSIANESELPAVQSKPQPPKIGDNQIEGLIIMVSEAETSIFNKIIEFYQKEIKNNEKNKTEILGVKHIAQSILDFANREFFKNSMPLIFGSDHNSLRQGAFEKQKVRAEIDDSLSNTNILLATWFDLILFKESPNTLLSIIEELVKIENHETSMVESETKTTGGFKQIENKEFYFKISSYLHLLVLNSTKNIFVQSLLKINYLLVLEKDVIGDDDNFLKQSFKEIALRNYEEKIDGKTKVYESIQLTYDTRSRKNLWKEEALGILISKWKTIANVITELCAKNSEIFFVAIFQKCVALLDKQLGIQVELIKKLMAVVENIEAEMVPGSSDSEKAKHTCRVLCGIIRQIIGLGQTLGNSSGPENSEQKYLNINNIVNMKWESDRYKESTFANRQEWAEQISKWNEIISENIYVYSQYKSNLETITNLFKDNHLYVALWFNKFHAETKVLVKKMSREQLEKIFSKFSSEIPALWESMTTDGESKKFQKSRFKRMERGKPRNRISSIKLQKKLSLIEKKAIVLNYTIKAELQLYSHYMLINYLNSQKNFTELFGSPTVDRQSIKSKPEIFKHKIIKKLILFSGDEQRLKTIKLEKETYANISRRTHKNMTFRTEEGLPSFTMEGIRTMNSIKKASTGCDFQDLLNAIHHFERPMDLELQLDDKWKEKFGEQEIEYLGELSDFVRYLNQINYLYEFWSWQESNCLSKEDRQKNEKKKRVQLLDGGEYYHDLQEIDRAFEEIEDNQALVQEMSIFKGEARKVMQKQQLTQMLKRLKIHNKELYMIIEAIIEGENYFKLIGSNLIGRDKNFKFRMILEDIIGYYKNNKREKPSVRMLDKMKESMQFQSQMMKKESGASFKNRSEGRGDQLREVQGNGPEVMMMKKNSRKGGSLVSHFEFAPEYYKMQSKIFRINCLIAALEVDNHIFRNIKHNHVLSPQRLEKLTIIGCQYYDKLESLLLADKVYDTSELMIGEQTLMRVKNVYEKKMLLLIITIIDMNYTMEDKVKRFTGRGRKQTTRVEFSNIPEEDLRSYAKVLEKYTDLLKKFMYWRVKQNIKRVEERQRFEKMNLEHEKNDQKDFNVCTFLEEVLELSEKSDCFQEEVLLIGFEMEIERQTNLKFSQEFRKTVEEETASLEIYKSEQEKVQYLRKKLSYLLLREMYFTLNYENDFLSEKSVNSKKNYTIYEQRIFKFYEEIIRLDYQEFMERKEEEIKKRSVHLKNYQFRYEQRPLISDLETSINQLICCLFNQLLTTYTTKVEQRMLTCRVKPIIQEYKESTMFQSYCASEYLKEVSKEPQKKKPIKKKKAVKKIHKESISSIFAHIFLSKQQTSDPQLPPGDGTNPIQALKNTMSNFNVVLVYSLQKYELSQALKIYLRVIGENDYSYSNCTSEYNRQRYGLCQLPSIFHEPITEAELQLMKNNESSLISLLKSQFLENINTMKCRLIRKNLISNVEKLYINLDVRHKVFESFKDRILNYELQKAKIYHQYMDYIRGLKLDVYSHMAGEESLPYIKIIHAVKLYRLKIKKDELEKRVNQEFEKNLQKWNKGIQKSLDHYNQWLLDQEKDWTEKEDQYQGKIKGLLDIYRIVLKETQRQSKVLRHKTAVSSAKSISINANSAKQLGLQYEKGTPALIAPPQNESALKKFSFLKQKGAKNSQSSKWVGQNQFISAKVSATESTKQNTKYQKITMTNLSYGYRINSSAGIRGISKKYDTTNFVPQEEKQIKERLTEAFTRSGVKSANSTIYGQGVRRYQSAQKFRRKEDYQQLHN